MPKMNVFRADLKNAEKIKNSEFVHQMSTIFEKSTFLTEKEKASKHLCFKAFHLVAEAGFEPAVLHFHCDENAAVGSADLTVHRTVIQHRLTLRVFALRSHNLSRKVKFRLTAKETGTQKRACFFGCGGRI